MKVVIGKYQTQNLHKSHFFAIYRNSQLSKTRGAKGFQ